VVSNRELGGGGISLSLPTILCCGESVHREMTTLDPSALRPAIVMHVISALNWTGDKWLADWSTILQGRAVASLNKAGSRKTRDYIAGGGAWPSDKKGALASRRSQVRIPAVAVN
jgi:hypothetical protein